MEAFNLFGLLQQHRQQNGLKRQGVIGLADSGDMFPGPGKQLVKNQLVRASQGAAKVGKRLLLLLDDLIDGFQRSSHVQLPYNNRKGMGFTGTGWINVWVAILSSKVIRPRRSD